MDLRETLAKTEKQIRKMQKDLELKENPENHDQQSIDTAFKHLQQHRTKLAQRSARYQMTKSISPNLLSQD